MKTLARLLLTMFKALAKAGFRMFRDSRKMESEEALTKIIKMANSSIIVLSKDYAFSERCLNELVTILKCKKKFQQKVLPVCYDVDPSDLRRQFGSIGEAFAMYEEIIEVENDPERKKEYMDKVSQWRTTLRQVANLAALVLPNVANGGNGSFFFIADSLFGRFLHSQRIFHLLLGLSYIKPSFINKMEEYNFGTQYSESPQFSTQINVQPSPPLQHDSNTKKKRGDSFTIEEDTKKKRGDSFTIEEDMLLASSWLNTSLDGIQGNDQKLKAFWLRTSEYFHKYKTFSSDRDDKSLMQRWSKIQQATNKFCGCLAQIESRHQSGVNEQDKISQAKKMYEEMNGKKFAFEHCWIMLRHQPKWLDESQKKKPTRKYKNLSTSPSMTSPSTQGGSIDLGDDSDCTVNLVDPGRPLGKKGEKRKIKESAESENSPIVLMLQEMREEKKQMNAKKMEMLLEKMGFEVIF